MAAVASANSDSQTTSPQAQSISLLESMHIALDTLRANKLRTLLTALGVIIGVAAVVALLALGRGAQQKVADQLSANGTNLLNVFAGNLSVGGFSSSGSTSALTSDDVTALENATNVPDAVAVAPEHSDFGTLVAGALNTGAQVRGVTPTYLTVRNLAIAQGEYINDSDVRAMSQIVVLGARTATTLFPDSDAIGQYLRINGQRFRVVGILAEKGASAFDSPDNAVFVPLTTAQRRLFGARDSRSGKPTVSAVYVQARDAASVAAVQAQIAATLRERHRRPADGSSDDFTVDNQQDLLRAFTEGQRTLTLYLGSVAAISLVVGGIGIMNIMLVSVRERTREIGLRKALGARERDILTQFLIEALTISTGGGLLGLLIGALIAVISSYLSDTHASVSLASVALAVGVAMIIGLFFGIEPARRAARLDPIAALRDQ